MKKQQMVINTIVFEEQVNRGARQLEFFESLSGFGVKHVEVRQEYFRSPAELADTMREAARLGIDLLYSVPKALFREGTLDADMVTQTLREAEELSAVAIKWTRGDFKGWTEPELDVMQRTVESFNGLLTVENDQTQRDGTLRDYLEFLRQCQDKGVPLYSTFDIGNWKWVGEDPLTSAIPLRPFVRYIHVKDVVVDRDEPEALPVGQGDLALKEVFALLPDDTLVALEYPCGVEPEDTIRAGLDWLARVQRS